MNILAALGTLLLDHPELVELMLDVIEGKKLTVEQVTSAIKTAMVEASDAEMRRELGGP